MVGSGVLEEGFRDGQSQVFGKHQVPRHRGRRNKQNVEGVVRGLSGATCRPLLTGLLHSFIASGRS